MTKTDTTHGDHAQKSPDRIDPSITLLLDTNLGLPTGEKPWSSILPAAGIIAQQSTDLVRIDKILADHVPSIAYVPTADFHRLVGKGDRHYRGLAIVSTTTGKLLILCG